MQGDRQDIVWGAALALLGLGVAAYSAQHYEIGSLRRMGPGFLPVGLGAILALLGVVIAVPAFWRQGQPVKIEWLQVAGIIGAVVLFAFGLERAGLILTTYATALLASAVSPRAGLFWRLVLAAVVTAVTWGIFVFGLQMALPLWPRGL